LTADGTWIRDRSVTRALFVALLLTACTSPYERGLGMEEGFEEEPK